MGLVPGRECGACTVCCVALPIDSNEIQKRPGYVCRHCTIGGCGIYETRPLVCRDYLCGWRQLPELDDTWRPDLSGVLIELHDGDIPPAYVRRPAFRLYVLGNRITVLKRGFVNLVVRLVGERIPVFLCMVGRPGYYPGIIFLNDLIGGAVAGGDARAVARALSDVTSTIDGYEHQPATLKHSGNSVEQPAS